MGSFGAERSVHQKRTQIPPCTDAMTKSRSYEIVDLTGADDPLWATALPTLQALRPLLTPERLAQVIVEGTPQGLRFTAVVEDGVCQTVAGWRIIANTSQIRKLYVDDLSTSPQARSKGYGKALLNHLIEVAKANDCATLDLDSGVQRFDAHRFYLRERMSIVSHHFAIGV